MAGEMGDRMSRAAEELKSRGQQAMGRMQEHMSEAQAGVSPGEHREGAVTRSIEYFTSQIPSGAFLTVAIGSIAASAILRAMDRRDDANFIGQWVPTFLILGLYNKLVKVAGSE